ncbi:MAG TPA: universal stress protein [Thermoplasmata archaeon]|nr:universal stress protein [Thermoplasmata archaeon]
MTESGSVGPATSGLSSKSHENGIERIVVGFDASPSSARASRLALSLAAPRSGRIWFVHVSEADRRMAEPLTDEERDVPSRAILRAMEALVAEAKSRGLHAAALTREGPAADVLLGVAREVNAGLITMGTRGRGDPSRALLGSVSAHVVANTHVPVMVVP